MEKELSKIVKLLESDDYKDRAKGEYLLVRDKHEKLCKMIERRARGELDFTPNCPMWQWSAQATAMAGYLYQLELKAAFEGVDLTDEG